jgi:hypothetical protein
MHPFTITCRTARGLTDGRAIVMREQLPVGLACRIARVFVGEDHNASAGPLRAAQLVRTRFNEGT